MSDEYKNQLKNLLNNLFQFDSADLDFGIYRIMNKKRDEIERFIENDLIDAVNVELGSELKFKLGLGKYSKSKQVNHKSEKMQATITNAEKSDKYESEISSQCEGEIFSHIYQFFSRYYNNGDFMSLRRYSQKEKYAIPYNGEEVVLHWANKDQYYIKTGENFRNYSFKTGGYSIKFLIADAEGTTNNNKAEKRFFVLADNDVNYDDSNKKLTVFFEYRGLSKDEEKEYGKKNVQETILATIKDEIISQIEDPELKGYLTNVVGERKNKNKGKNQNTEKSLLEKHLKVYAKKNTTDYFIHKNLKGFLAGELDFYIKNEVFYLDDLGTDNEFNIEQYVTRARVIKRICLKIIDFLAQIEDFQKMLFEKKKFVVKTDYCMTLDNVPAEMYADIVNNEEQLNEWNILYRIDENEQSTRALSENYGINEAYLEANPYLVIDTKFFGQKFKDRLLASFDDIDEAVDGLMINSENWQALNLIQTKYAEKVKCTYIDPPYNTGGDGFPYKDGYQHSSWLSMLNDRIHLSKNLLGGEGIFFSSIGEEEVSSLKKLLDISFDSNAINTIVTRRQDKNLNLQFIDYGLPSLSVGFEYILAYRKQESTNIEPVFMKSSGKRATSGYWKGFWNDADRPTMRYDILDFTPKEGQWKWKQEVANEAISNYKKYSSKHEQNETLEEYWERTGEKLKFIRRLSSGKGKNMGVEHWVPPSLEKLRSSNWTDMLTLKAISNSFGLQFPSPKNVDLLSILFEFSGLKNGIALDFFAGSGTTAHAILNLNKKDDGNRKYIIVEMGDYFETVTKPRIQKVMYSDKWNGGKPKSNEGISHIFKYQSIEQYEDTINNIEFSECAKFTDTTKSTESDTVQRTLANMDGYFLRYMLDFETRDSSPCRLNVEKLSKPFDYTLKITHGNEIKEETVDLVETFNYLLGIHVKQIRTFNNNGTYYKFVLGKKDEDDEIAIIWRDTDQLDLKADKVFIEEIILDGIKPSKTYINSDFYVKKAHPIELEFKKLMVV